MVAHLHSLGEPLTPDIDTAQRTRAMITAALSGESPLVEAILNTFADQANSRATAALADAFARNPDLPVEHWAQAAHIIASKTTDFKIDEVAEIITQGSTGISKEKLLAAVTELH